MRLHYIPGAVLLVLAYLLAAVPSWGRDSPQDCATYGPHSDSCARGLQNQLDPQWQAEQIRRQRQRDRNAGHPDP